MNNEKNPRGQFEKDAIYTRGNLATPVKLVPHWFWPQIWRINNHRIFPDMKDPLGAQVLQLSTRKLILQWKLFRFMQMKFF